MPRATRSLPRVSLLLTLVAACEVEHADSERCIAIAPDEILRVGHYEEELQGTSMQGIWEQGIWENGIWENGIWENGTVFQGTSDQGTKFGIVALNGMRLALADGTGVTLQGGTLVAGTRVGAAALRDVELVGRSRDDLQFAVRIAEVEQIDGSERIAIEAGHATACGPGKAGMFVPGSWDETGAHEIDGDELTYACMDGVIAKCVSWGYAPWDVGAELHQTCTRLARADYCGDGQPWTMNGTRIDVYDTLGVQSPVHDPELDFEAAWGEDGALCVNATRYDISDADGETVLPACFATLPRCESLAEASELGARIVNDSAHSPIAACDPA
jgi:hypothetical protein